MAQGPATITIEVALAWWVLPYIRVCALFAALFGMVPDADKIVRTAMRGVKTRVAR